MDNEKGQAVNLISVNYAKAFNTMKYQACLQQFERLGASNFSLKRIHTFLEGRTMTVKVNDEQSELRPVPGGSPQGTILGNYLFIISTNNLEDRREQSINGDTEEDPTVIISTVNQSTSSSNDSFYLSESSPDDTPGLTNIFLTPGQANFPTDRTSTP